MAGVACPQCGADCPATARFCVACRYEFAAPQERATPPVPRVAAPAPPPPPPAYAPDYNPAPPGAAAPPVQSPAATYAHSHEAPPVYGGPVGYAYPAPAYGAPPVAAYPAPYPPNTYAPYAPPYPAPFPPPYPYPAPMVPAAEALGKEAGAARWGAAVVDAVLVVGVYLLLAINVRPLMQAGIGPPFMFITLFYVFGYYIVPDGLRGATLGKLLTGVRVVDIHLRPATPGKMAVRSVELLLWVFLGGLIFLIVEIVLASKNGQTLGDRMAHTYVVRKRDLANTTAARA